MAPGPPGYVELRCRSAFSFLEAASNPEDLVECAAELGYGALALGDRDGVYGAPRFHKAARLAGIRPLVSARLTVEEPGPHLLLLVESRAGYRNLCRLITRGRADRAKNESQVGWDDLEEHAAGLVALVRGDADLSPALLHRSLATFGRERVWVDVSRHLDRAAEAAARRAVDLAESLRVPVVATNDVAHARPEQRRLLDALTCLRFGTSLDRAGRKLVPNAERHLRPPHEMVERFADRPEWIHASGEIADRCAFTLENLGYRFPEFPVPAGETHASWLRHLTFDGARRRYGARPAPRVRSQLERELALIEKLGLPGYFLIVHDIARFAADQKI
ncbi:MAG: PHP domain-containing protein, partial [Myxococcota bacterium]